MSTPQTFPMTSAPATKYQPRSRRPTRDGAHCVSAHIRQVRADASLKGVQPLVRSHYTFPSRLPDPSRLAVPARPVVVGAAPTHTLRFQGQAAPSFSDPLRRATVGYLNPLDHRRLVAHSALKAQPGKSQGRPPKTPGSNAHRPTTGLPNYVLPQGPHPGRATVRSPQTDPPTMSFMPRAPRVS
jgi:hypothetical protein